MIVYNTLLKCLACFYNQHGAGRADVHSVATDARLSAIRSVYGVSVAHNLLEVEASDNDPSSSVFQMSGLISNCNFVAKKTTMVLFINGMYHSYNANGATYDIQLVCYIVS